MLHLLSILDYLCFTGLIRPLWPRQEVYVWLIHKFTDGNLLSLIAFNPFSIKSDCRFAIAFGIFHATTIFSLHNTVFQLFYF